MINRARTHLICPVGGWWLDPASQKHRDCDFLPPAPLPLGVGLPGVLWADTYDRNRKKPIPQKKRLQQKSQRRRNTSADLRQIDFAASSFNELSDAGESCSVLSSRETGSEQFSRMEDASEVLPRYRRAEASGHFGSTGRVVWREIRPTVEDPDQPYNERIELLADSGLGYAAAAPFNIHGKKGIVVYMAREGADLARLQSTQNETYLCSAADFIGSALALRAPRENVVRERKLELRVNKRRVVHKLSLLVKHKVQLSDIVHGRKTELDLQDFTSHDHGCASLEIDSPANESSGKKQQQSTLGFLFHLFKSKIQTTLTKCKGANVMPPPPSTIEQSLWTFVSVLVSCLILTRTNDAFKSDLQTGGMPLGPFGALMTLQFGLTAAPASQPRSIIFGQAISITIALGVSNLDKWLTMYIRQSLATAIAIAVMAKLGVTHPPAGASALLFSSGDWSWDNMGLMLIGNAMAIFVATICNNLNDKRQYPTFWGTGHTYIQYAWYVYGCQKRTTAAGMSISGESSFLQKAPEKKTTKHENVNNGNLVELDL